jgi:hypothetical protein
MITYPNLAILLYLILGTNGFRKKLNDVQFNTVKRVEISYTYYP